MRPLGQLKWEWVMPSSLALSFIIWTNFSTLPAVCSAMATAASLPLRSMVPYRPVIRVSLSPSTRYRDVPSSAAAVLEAVMT